MHEGAPQRHVAVVQAPLGPVQGRREGHRDAIAERHPVAPVALGDVQRPARAGENGPVAKRGQDARAVAVEQPAQARQVHVVVVVVAHQHRIDARQFVERQAGRAHPLRPGPLHRAGAPGEERVGENVEPGDLDQRGRLADIRHPKVVDRVRRHGLGRILYPPRPGLPAAGALPLDDFPEPVRHPVPRHEEPVAVIVIRRRALVIAVLSFAHRPLYSRDTL
jgi:hypothetical protein